MTFKFQAHDIVTDGTYEYRIYSPIGYLSSPSYDCVSISGSSYGHTVRSESELTLVRKFQA